MFSKKDSLSVIVLVVIAIYTHLNWFNPSSAINFSDWLYFPDAAVAELWNSWGTWISMWNLGYPNIQLFFFPFKMIWSIVALLGFSYDTATKITFFIPIALLGFITPYILGRKLFKNPFTSFVLALFYGSTSYFIVKQIAHIPIAFVYAISPLVLYVFIESLERKKIEYWYLFSLLLSIITWYEVRIALLNICILLLYALIVHVHEFKKQIRFILISGCIYILLNVFWILPILFTSVNTSITELTDRKVFGDFLFDIHHAFTLMEASWTGETPNMEFIQQRVKWFYWFIPIIAFLPTLIANKLSTNNKKLLIFFVSLSLLGIILTKQAAPPFPWLYSLLFEYIPGFSLFREASKFYLFTSIGYFGLLGLTLSHLDDISKYLNLKITYVKLILFSTVLIISFINLYPLFSNQFETTFVSSKIPKEYQEINNVIANDSDFYRTVWLESCCQYIYFSSNHPRVVGADFVLLMDNLLGIEYYGEDIEIRYVNFFKHPKAKWALQNSSIKYIGIPTKTDYKNNTVNIKLVNEMKKNNYLTLSPLSNDSVTVFYVKNHYPLFYTTDNLYPIAPNQIDFKKISPMQYSLDIQNISKETYLHFSTMQHDDWKMHIGSFNWLNVLFQKDYLFNNSQYQNNVITNIFLLSPEIIKNNTEIGEYTLNEDGSINIHVTVYFLPQSYFYIGLILSSITLIVITLSFFYIRFHRYEKKNSK